MFMVLLLHANYVSFGSPGAEDVRNHFFPSLGRIYAEQLSIVAVNVYILISGWFGIRPRVRSFTKLALQVFTYSALITLAWLLSMRPPLHLYYFTDVLIVGQQYWFVVSYFLLYLLSPVLNSFAEHATRRQFRKVLAVYFAFEFVYGWFAGKEGFKGGYSAMSFVGLYLLARYMKLYGGRLFSRSFASCMGWYIAISTLTTGLIAVQLYAFGGEMLFGNTSYNSPFVVLASVFLFLSFSKLDFHSPAVNYCSSSALSVYLIHVNPFLWQRFQKTVRLLYHTFGGTAGVLAVVAGLLVLFALCIAIDKVRIWLTPVDKICSIAEKIVERAGSFFGGEAAIQRRDGQ